jgi:hypothetical protein
MKAIRVFVLPAALLTVTLISAPVGAQLPSVGSLPSSIIPDKAALLEQTKKLLTDLTAMKQDPKLPAADKSKVDALMPKASSVSSELAKPQVEPSRLTQLAGQRTFRSSTLPSRATRRSGGEGRWFFSSI